jgi:hypothetical protein
LSPDAAQLLGRGLHEVTLSHSDFLVLIQSDDREIYTQALEEYQARPGAAFRLEFRVAAGQGRWRWLELRATIVSEQEDLPSDCLGLLADITQHPDTLVILAARVVVGQTDDARECGDAIDLLRLLDRRPLPAIAAAAFPNGGAT